MRKFLSVVVLYVIIHIPISCDDSNGCQFSDVKSEIRSIAIEPGEFDNDVFQVKHGNDKSTLAIQVEVREVEYLELATVQTASFITSACACPPPSPKEAEKIVSFSVQISEDFTIGGKTYLANSEANSLFKVANRQDQSINEFILDQNDDPFLFAETTNAVILQFIDDPDYFTADISVLITFENGNSVSNSLSDFVYD